MREKEGSKFLKREPEGGRFRERVRSRRRVSHGAQQLARTELRDIFQTLSTSEFCEASSELLGEKSEGQALRTLLLLLLETLVEQADGHLDAGVGSLDRHELGRTSA